MSVDSNNKERGRVQTVVGAAAAQESLGVAGSETAGALVTAPGGGLADLCGGGSGHDDDSGGDADDDDDDDDDDHHHHHHQHQHHNHDHD